MRRYSYVPLVGRERSTRRSGVGGGRGRGPRYLLPRRSADLRKKLCRLSPSRADRPDVVPYLRDHSSLGAADQSRGAGEENASGRRQPALHHADQGGRTDAGRSRHHREVGGRRSSGRNRSTSAEETDEVSYFPPRLLYTASTNISV